MVTEDIPKKDRDRITDPGEELEWAKALLKMLDEHSALNARINEWPEAQPGSAMFGDDKATHPLPTSACVHYLMLAGADNLAGLRSLLVESETATNLQLNLHPFAPYTLLRNAIECASTAIWILAPSTRHERVLRTARIELEDAKKNKAALTNIGGNGDETYARRIKLIRQMIEPYKQLTWSDVTQRFLMTDMLTEIGRLELLNGLNPLAKWQIASGMAHGRRWAGLLLSDREQVGNPAANGDSTFKLTGSFKYVLWLARSAYDLLDEGDKLAALRSRAHHRP